MKQLLFTLFVALQLNGYSQCPFPVSLDSTGNCIGSVLNVNTARPIATISWYKDNTLLKTVTASIGTGAGVTVAGGNGPGQNANQLHNPVSVVVDANENIYISDQSNNRVQKWAPGATAGITIAGGNGAGPNDNQLDFPGLLFVDGIGNLYVSDIINSRVQKWYPEAAVGITVAGGNGAGSAPNQLIQPWGMSIDFNGNLFVVDQYNNRVQRFPPGSNSASNGITVAGGNGPGSAANQLNLPIGIFIDDMGNIYIADAGNYRIQKWAPGATSGITVAGGNGKGSAANQMDTPNGIFVDKSGNIYVADPFNNRIQLWTPGAVAGITVAGGNGAGTSANQLSAPEDVFIDQYGYLYIADDGNHRIQKWAPSTIDTSYSTLGPGIYKAVVTDINGCTVTTNAVTINALSAPAITITSSSNKVYSCDLLTFRSISVNGGSSPSYQWKINGVSAGTDKPYFQYSNWHQGDIVSCVLTSNSSCATAQTATSNSISVDVAGQSSLILGNKPGTCLGDTLFVSTRDSVTQIRWYNGNQGVDTANADSYGAGIIMAGGFDGGPASSHLVYPEGIFIDANENLYVVDEFNNRVQKWAPGATSGVTVAGGNGPGAEANQLDGPVSIWVDPAGNIYVTDYGNYRVQKWAPGASTGTTVAGGNGKGGAANQFNNPVGICVDQAGNVFVADDNNNRVQKWAPGAIVGVTVAGGHGASDAANSLFFPEAVFVDSIGNLYVTDEFNARIQKWSPGAIAGVTVAGGNGRGAGNNQLSYPYGVYVDASGNIYIADAGNNRIQKWAPGASTGTTVAGGNGPGSNANQLLGPRWVFVDKNGSLYVSEDLNDRVQKWGQLTNVDTTYKPVSAGTYTAVVVNSSGCSITSAPILIRQQLNPQVAISTPDSNICAGASITLSASTVNGGTAPLYQWQENGINVGTNSPSFNTHSLTTQATMRCIMTSNAACIKTPSDTSAPLIVHVSNAVTPAIKITTPEPTICAGATATFSADTINAGANPLYQWLVNGTNKGTNEPDFSSVSLKNGDTIRCQLTSDAACVTINNISSNAIVMQIDPPIKTAVTISASANTSCSGGPVTFTATATNAGDTPVFEWKVDGINQSESSSNFTSSSLLNGDSVYCLMNSSLACTLPDTSNAIQMVVNPSPSISFEPDTLYTSQNNGVQLSPMIAGIFSKYQWYPATALDQSYTLHPTANPANPTTYQLTVTNDYQCSATGKVTVIPSFPLEMPAAFTPNGDGRNDLFRIPPGVQFNLNEMAVFDRWGNRIFITNNISEGWDGNLHGQPAKAGAYTYTISGKNLAGMVVNLQGTVLLIR